jgi:hypothetical integral membrane protein (TIGR02206 family)
MEQFFTKDYTGAPFELFGPAHLAALAIIVAINLWLGWRGSTLSQRSRLVIRFGMAALLLVNESAWHLWNYFTGQWTIQTMLPLHLCSLLVFLSAVMLATKSYAIYEFAYFLGIAGASQALLTPDAGIYGFPHFRFFQIMISHGAIFTAAIYMTAVEGFRPYWRSLRRVIVGMNLYMLMVMPINYLIGSNYLFIAHKPETPSLLDVLGPWPWYIIPVEILAITLMFLLYLPFAVRDRKQTISHHLAT